MKGRVDRTNERLRNYRYCEHDRLTVNSILSYFDYDLSVQQRFKAYVRTFYPEQFEDIFCDFK